MTAAVPPSPRHVPAGARPDKLAEEVFKAARVTGWTRYGHLPWSALEAITAAHPLRSAGFFFDVPLLAGEHVTEDTGTGFVHTAPGHGTEDFEIWEQNRWELENRQIDTTIPFTVNEAGFFTAEARGFEGKRSDKETYYSFTTFSTPGTIYRFDVATRQDAVTGDAPAPAAGAGRGGPGGRAAGGGGGGAGPRGAARQP